MKIYPYQKQKAMRKLMSDAPLFPMPKGRRQRPQRFKVPTHYRGIQHTPLILARLAALSQQKQHREFTKEYEDAKLRHMGRTYRNLDNDRSTPSSTRFYSIAARSDYQRRRGR